MSPFVSSRPTAGRCVPARSALTSSSGCSKMPGWSSTNSPSIAESPSNAPASHTPPNNDIAATARPAIAAKTMSRVCRTTTSRLRGRALCNPPAPEPTGAAGSGAVSCVVSESIDRSPAFDDTALVDDDRRPRPLGRSTAGSLVGDDPCRRTSSSPPHTPHGSSRSSASSKHDSASAHLAQIALARAMSSTWSEKNSGRERAVAVGAAGDRNGRDRGFRRSAGAGSCS